MRFYTRRQGFTLIELLVVIAIIAILAVVVVLTLNPAQLLAQSRDANRVSDLATLNSAIGLYQTDTGGAGFMGTSSMVYVSLADNTSSTCGSLGLPALPTSSLGYDCSPSTSTRSINNTGWIPIDFTKINAGTPLGSLPIDPVNTSSSGLYYTYNTSSSQFMVSALPESQKQKLALAQKPMIPNYPDVIANGSSLTINPLFNSSGLVGYWPMDEGAGSSTQDLSGNNNLGNWTGTAAGTNGTYYATGKVGSYAGYFNGINNNINTTFTATSTSGTMTVWINPGGSMVPPSGFFPFIGGFGDPGLYIQNSSGKVYIQWNGAAVCTAVLFANTWQFVTGSWDGITLTIFLNGTPCGTRAYSPATSQNFRIGNSNYQGLIDDFRIYNRALSAAEVQALYNAGR